MELPYLGTARIAGRFFTVGDTREAPFNICQVCTMCHVLDYLTENPQKSYGVEIIVPIS